MIVVVRQGRRDFRTSLDQDLLRIVLVAVVVRFTGDLVAVDFNAVLHNDDVLHFGADQITPRLISHGNLIGDILGGVAVVIIALALGGIVLFRKADIQLELDRHCLRVGGNPLLHHLLVVQGQHVDLHFKAAPITPLNRHCLPILSHPDYFRFDRLTIFVCEGVKDPTLRPCRYRADQPAACQPHDQNTPQVADPLHTRASEVRLSVLLRAASPQRFIYTRVPTFARAKGSADARSQSVQYGIGHFRRSSPTHGACRTPSPNAESRIRKKLLTSPETWTFADKPIHEHRTTRQ